MSDTDLEAALRRWRAEPTRLGAAQLARQYGRAGQDLPWDVLLESPTWWSFAETVAKWLAEPLREDLGCTSAELDAAETRLGIALPQGVRELYRLVGRRNDLLEPDLVPLEELTVETEELVLASSYRVKWSVSTNPSPNPAVRAAGAATLEQLSQIARLSFMVHLPASQARRRGEVIEGISPATLSETDWDVFRSRLGLIELPSPGLDSGPVLFASEDALLLSEPGQARFMARTLAIWNVMERWLVPRWTLVEPAPRYPIVRDLLSTDLDAVVMGAHPLLVLPCVHRSHWWGMFNEAGADVYLESACDYDRLNLDPDTSEEFPRTGHLLRLRGSSESHPNQPWAVLFDAEAELCAFAQLPTCLMVLLLGASQPAVLSLVVQLPQNLWELGIQHVDVPEGGLALVDSAADGRRPEEAAYGVGHANLDPGLYAVDRIEGFVAVIDHAPGHVEHVQLTALRFRPLPDNQSERATG